MTRHSIGIGITCLALAFAGCLKEPEVDGKSVYEWLSLLNSDNWTVQAQASDALSRLGAAGIPYLQRNLRVTDPSLRRGVVITFGKMGPVAKELVPVLLKRIAIEEVAPIRAEILRALVLINPAEPTIEAELTKRLRDQTAEVREAAQAGLDKLHPPKEIPKAASPDPAAAAPAWVLREAVAAQLPGVAFAELAEVVRESRRAAVVWPILKDGKRLDDDIVAFIFEKQEGDRWAPVAGNLKLSASTGADELARALGGADKQQVLRPCGVARSELVAYLATKGKAFKESLAAGKAAEAMGAYQELSRAFGLRQVVFSDALPEMLGKGAFDAPWKLDAAAEAEWIPVEVTLDGKAKAGTLSLRPCDQGVVIAEMK